MSWNSWQEFWTMGGYALYVWGSVGVVLLCIAGELLELARRRKAIVQTLALKKKRSGSTGGTDKTRRAAL
ncbi:MAG: heme exporter protein CcmD [Polaromonas sp.]|nr:heme exporter protein CcmD [Polaromonas sp.]